MIVGSYFDGDNDDTLKWLQHEMYNENLFRLFAGPRDRYLAAARLLRVNDALSKKLRGMEGFDHRTLHMAHDIIAAYFRFAHSDRGQLMLGEDVEAYRDRLRKTWRRFFESEIEELGEDDEFVRAVCRAAAFGNTDPGYSSEGWLLTYLKEHYENRGMVLLSLDHKAAVA